MEKKISVIIPFYNNSSWLKEAIESVFHQTYKNLEIIVVNDGSSEDLKELINFYKGKIHYCIKENGGAASARNLGITLSTGDYISFLDSDDIWLPNKLEEQISFMEKNNYKWSHSDYYIFNDKDSRVKYIKCLFKDNIIPLCLVWNPIATPSVTIESSVLKNDKRLCFAEWRNVGEDSYLWLKLGEKYPLGYLPKALIKVRMRGDNTSRQAIMQMKYRGETYNEIKLYKLSFNSYFSYLLLRMSTFYCKKMYSFIIRISKFIKLSKIQIEYFARITYVLPYVIFKLLKKVV